MGQDGVKAWLSPAAAASSSTLASGIMATRLDQVAQWLPEGRWAAGRWRPDPPTVPKWLIARVEAVLQQGPP